VQLLGPVEATVEGRPVPLGVVAANDGTGGGATAGSRRRDRGFKRS
jgi:hypothetical protein